MALTFTSTVPLPSGVVEVLLNEGRAEPNLRPGAWLPQVGPLSMDYTTISKGSLTPDVSG